MGLIMIVARTTLLLLFAWFLPRSFCYAPHHNLLLRLQMGGGGRTARVRTLVEGPFHHSAMNPATIVVMASSLVSDDDYDEYENKDDDEYSEDDDEYDALLRLVNGEAEEPSHLEITNT